MGKTLKQSEHRTSFVDECSSVMCDLNSDMSANESGHSGHL